MRNILEKIKEKLTGKKSFKKLDLAKDATYYEGLLKIVKVEPINDDEFNIILDKEALYILTVADQVYKFYDAPNLIIGLFTDMAYRKIFDKLKNLNIVDKNEKYDLTKFNKKYLEDIVSEEGNDDNYSCIVKNAKNKSKYIFEFNKLTDDGENLIYNCKFIGVE